MRFRETRSVRILFATPAKTFRRNRHENNMPESNTMPDRSLLDACRCVTNCYGVIVKLRHGGIQDIEKVGGGVPAEEDGGGGYLEKGQGFLERFFGACSR